jgi:carbon-monoxide dehydrogenase large subunit
MALGMADAKGFPARRAEARKDGKLRGLGISNTIERAAAPRYEGAEIRFDRSGAVTLFSGASNHGQGHETAFKQIVAENLGLDPREVTYIHDDTDQVFFGDGTGGSRSATIGGSAVLMAADKIKKKATAIAAHVMKVAPEDLRFEDGMFVSPMTDDEFTRKDVALASLSPAKLPKDMEVGAGCDRDYSPAVENYRTAASLEVEIDRRPVWWVSCATPSSMTSAL